MKDRTLYVYNHVIVKQEMAHTIVTIFNKDTKDPVDTPHMGFIADYVLDKYGEYKVIETYIYYNAKDGERHLNIYISKERG